MTMNPADEAAENYKNEMDKLRAEVISFFFNNGNVLRLLELVGKIYI